MHFATDYYITIIIVSPKRKICEVARADQATKIKKDLNLSPSFCIQLFFLLLSFGDARCKFTCNLSYLIFLHFVHFT